jgi:hypothetical protein
MNPHFRSTTPTVKLFPRLAPARLAAAPVRVERSTIRAPQSKLATVPLQNDRTQVRARLLRMILDNERARRTEDHPNAS